MLLVGRATECRQRIIVHWGVAIAVCPRMGGSDGGSACGHAFGANLTVLFYVSVKEYTEYIYNVNLKPL